MVQDHPVIDYGLLGRALDWYKSIGYTYFEAPWMVEPVYSNMTLPNAGDAYITHNRQGDAFHMVGSAEQAFFQEVLKGNLYRNKKYVSCTPCFRLGDTHGKYHQDTFMKVELSYVTTDDEDDTWEWSFLYDAEYFMNQNNFHKNVVDRANDIVDILGMDVTTREYIELGSYGKRAFEVNGETLYFHFGTGLALPRFQFTINK